MVMLIGALLLIALHWPTARGSIAHELPDIQAAAWACLAVGLILAGLGLHVAEQFHRWKGRP